MLGDYGIKVVDWMVWNSKKRTLHPSRKPTHWKLKIHKSIKNLLFPFLVNFRNTISIRYWPRIGADRWSGKHKYQYNRSDIVDTGGLHVAAVSCTANSYNKLYLSSSDRVSFIFEILWYINATSILHKKESLFSRLYKNFVVYDRLTLLTIS